jgi:hypothetical protein
MTADPQAPYFKPLTPTQIVIACATAQPRHFPDHAIASIHADPQALINLLEAGLEDCFDWADAGELREKGDWRLPTFAFYILAELKAPRAHEYLLRALRLSTKDIDFLLDDALCEDWPDLLLTTFTGNLAPLKSIVTDSSLDEIARGTALETIASLIHHQIIGRDETEHWLASLFDSLEKTTNYVWIALVQSIADLRMTSLMPMVRAAFQQNLVDQAYISLEDIEKIAAGGNPWSEWSDTYEPEFHHPVANAPEILRDWHYFSEDYNEEDAEDEDEMQDDDFLDDPSHLPPTPAWQQLAPEYIPAPKIGRNEPCPCGSGKKYKKCCGSLI